MNNRPHKEPEIFDARRRPHRVEVNQLNENNFRWRIWRLCWIWSRLIPVKHDKCLGYANGNIENDALEIVDICIYEKYRHQGLGTAFLMWIVLEAKGQHLREIKGVIRCHDYNQFKGLLDWYRKNGFCAEMNEKRDDVVAAIKMIL